MTPPVLVFGDDGSAGSDAAWGWICAQRWPDWRAEVLTAVPPPLGPPPSPDDARPHPWESPHPRLAPAQAGFTEVLHQRVDADPRYVLSGRTDAALLVVGPTGTGLLKALHLGSTTEYLLHHPPVPVVVARNTAPVRRVLACVDGSPHAERAASALARMPWRAAVDEVVLLTVSDDATAAEEALGRARALLGTFGSVVEVIESGWPHADVILDMARERAVDLVVAGTRGHSSVKEAIIGSTANTIARHCECAVLLAHDGTRS